MILCIRTDNPQAELYLLNSDGKVLATKRWLAHKILAETLHKEVDSLLTESGINLHGLTKLVVYSGPGSFTGLRIGIATANTFAYGLGIPIIGVSGENWLNEGLYNTKHLQATVLPVYGQEPHITQAKK